MSTSRSGRRLGAALASTALAVGLAALPSQAASPGSAVKVVGGSAARGASTQRTPGYLDARQLTGKAALVADRTRLRTQSRGQVSFASSLGAQGIVDIDPLTGTPRNVTRLDGFLTGRSSASARSIALGYVRSHLSTFGLVGSDLSTLHLRSDYVDSYGVHNLAWTQLVGGIPVFGNGLKVKVTKQGQVLAVQGSPVSHLATLAGKAPRATLSAASARGHAASDVGGHVADTKVTSATAQGRGVATTRWANHDYATRVWFLTPAGLRPGWSTYTHTGPAAAYQHVVDAASGKVLFRRSTIDSESATTTEKPAAQKATHKGDARVYDYYPGAAKGGTAKIVNLYDRGFLSKSRVFLNGTSVVAFADTNDDNQIESNEKTPIPGTKAYAQFKLKPFKSSGFCTKAFVCTWDPAKAYSWTKNKKADVTQAFYLASNFHDWLQNGPAKFTTKAGNFSAAGGDPVLLNALDGANTAGGLPDGNHIDNANMDTPPDGTPPTMQMYLWHAPGATDAQDAYVPTSSAFDASVEYHEYTHGLSNRLVVDASGASTLNSIEAGAMGEAWSDYYAMDYLVQKGFVKDTSASGEVLEGKYLVADKAPFRTEAIDCAIGSKAKNCTSITGVKGGYTYGDFPTIGGGPEVHSSGEVWSQTLWDLRTAFGPTVADTLITRAMSYSADNPSMLDMRNAIVQADLVGRDGKDTAAIWKIFAARGMGFFAGAESGDDAFPAEDFHRPPPPYTPRESIGGTVTDPTTGQPVAGAVVAVAGQGDQFSTVTNANGQWEIDGLYRGTYQKVTASAPGYFADSKPAKTNHLLNFSIIRDYAASSGGAEIVDYNGPNYAPQCGPDGAIDLGLSTGWGSTTGDDAGDPTNTFVPKHITIDLHQQVDITTIGLDPAATCGDGASASLADYTIETSVDGQTFVPAASGTFTSADDAGLNTITPTTGKTGVRYVRLTMLSNQTPDFATNCPAGAYSGCSFTDMTELAVFGSPTAVPAG